MKKSKDFLCGYIVSAVHYKGVKYITEHTESADLEHFDVCVAVPMKYLTKKDSSVVDFNSTYFNKIKYRCEDELNDLFEDHFVSISETQIPNAVLKFSFDNLFEFI